MIDVLTIERKTGDTFPILAKIVGEDGPYSLQDVSQIVLVVSDLKDESSDPAPVIEIFSTGTVVNPAAVEGDDDLGHATFPVTPALAELVKDKYFAEIRMIESTFIHTTETFEYKVTARVGSATGV